MSKEEAFTILAGKQEKIKKAKREFDEWKKHCIKFAKYKIGQKVGINCKQSSDNGKIGIIHERFIQMPYWKQEKISIRYVLAKIKKDGTESKFKFWSFDGFTEEELIEVND